MTASGGGPCSGCDGEGYLGEIEDENMTWTEMYGKMKETPGYDFLPDPKKVEEDIQDGMMFMKDVSPVRLGGGEESILRDWELRTFTDRTDWRGYVETVYARNWLYLSFNTRFVIYVAAKRLADVIQRELAKE